MAVGTAQTNFLLDGGNVVTEQTGTETVSYLRGVNLISKTADATEYYLFNAHGDVVNLTSTTGATTKAYDYDAFGNERSPGEADENPFRYCGEYWDAETGTYYLRARYYDPLLGRFMTEDPLLAGLNWYTYCTNNPVGYIDPWGLVEVGLKEYAETYKDSVVYWDPNTYTAYVYYQGCILSVQSTPENTRNGHIYVDDSLFVNAFGVGDGLVVYRDSVTGNISIRAAFNVTYVGGMEDNFLPIMEDLQSSYLMAFLYGIEDIWSGTFGDFNVSTYTGLSKYGINVTISDQIAIATTRRHQGGWSPANYSTIFMYIGESANPEYDLFQFRWTAAHEFAHVLGVGDGYKKNIPVASITCGNSYQYRVHEIDIEKVLMAWLTGHFQEW